MTSDTERQGAFKSPIFRGSIGIAIAITDSLGRFLECNPAWSAMLGHSQTDLQGLDIAALTHPDDRAEIEEMLERLVRRETPDFIVEKRYVTRSGQTIWCETHMALADAESQAPCRLLLVARDITDQRLAEQQVQKNQRLLRMAANVAGVSSWTFDGTNQTIFWSDECCSLFGRPLGHQPTLKEGIAHYAAEYHEMIESAVEYCLSQGEPFDFEAEIVRVGGQRLWVRAIGESVRDATGAITGLEGAIQDISAQRHLEEARHASANKFSAALESMSDAFFTLDRHCVITFANQEMIGRRTWDLFPDAENGSFHVFYQRVMDTGIREKLVEFYPRASLWLEVHAHPTQEGLAIHFQDITQRRKDEAKLRLLQACVERMNDIIIITDADSSQAGGPNVVYVNKAFEQITGYRSDEIIGKTTRMLQGPKTQRDEPGCNGCDKRRW